MSEELGTRDVVEQLDARLGNLEQGQRDLRVEMVTRFAQMDSPFTQVDSRLDRLHGEMSSGFSQLRGEMDRRFSSLQSVVVGTLTGVANLVVSVVVGGTAVWLKL